MPKVSRTLIVVSGMFRGWAGTLPVASMLLIAPASFRHSRRASLPSRRGCRAGATPSRPAACQQVLVRLVDALEPILGPLIAAVGVRVVSLGQLLITTLDVFQADLGAELQFGQRLTGLAAGA